MSTGMNPQYNDIGRQFVQMYYQLMETDRKNLAAFYNEQSMMTFENGTFSGQQQIMEKLLSNPSAKYSILTLDCQPSVNNGVIAFIMGDVSLDNSPPMKFSHMVQLLPNGSSYFVLNDVFRVAPYLLAALLGVAATTGLASDTAVDETALKKIDIGEDSAPKPHDAVDRVLYEVTVVPGQSTDASLPFCGQLITPVWLTNDEVEQASNPGSLFEIVKRKFANRVDQLEDNSLFRRLSALAVLTTEGDIKVVENNVQNETKNLRVLKKLSLPIADRHMLEAMNSSDEGYIFTVNDGECQQNEDSESVSVEDSKDHERYVDIAFNGAVTPQPEVKSDNQSEGDTEGVEAPSKADDDTVSIGSMDTDVSEPHSQDAAKPAIDDDKRSITSEESVVSEASSTNELEGEEDAGSEPQQEEKKVYDVAVYDEAMNEDYLKDRPDEIKYMDLFEIIDQKGNENEELHPVRLRIRTKILAANGKGAKNLDTYNTLLLTKKELELCESENYHDCINVMSQKLMKRYEAEETKSFVRGRFFCMLHALIMQYNIKAEWFPEKKDDVPRLDVAVHNYTTSFVNFIKWQNLFGWAHSSDNRLQMNMHFVKDDYEPIVLMNSNVYLGRKYKDINYERAFIAEFPMLRIEENKYDRYTDERVFNVKKPEKYEMNLLYERPQMAKQELKDYVSTTDRKILQVPNNIKGYSISYKDYEKQPDLQRIWKEVLISMGWMKEDDDLKKVLETVEFTYDELKEFFKKTYSIIAKETYEENKEFYDSADISAEAVAAGYKYIQNGYKVYTGLDITRLPPVVKKMRSDYCPAENMIVSLTTEEIIQRLRISIGAVLHRLYNKENPKKDYYLSVLCTTAAVFVQNWSYMQKFMGYKDYVHNAWATLMSSFVTMGQSLREEPNIRKTFKAVIGSEAALICRKYISLAGDVATSGYRKLNVMNVETTSLVGALGNLLDIKMNSEASKIVTAMEDYFHVAKREDRIGSAVGICVSLQLLERLQRCFNIENTNDFFIHRLQMLGQSTSSILHHFHSTHEEYRETTSNDDPASFILRACDPNDVVVEEIMKKLFGLSSIESAGDIRTILNARQYRFPTLDKNGNLLDEETQFTLAGDEIAMLKDGDELMNVIEDSNNKIGKLSILPQSFLQILGPEDDMDDSEKKTRKDAVMDVVKVSFERNDVNESQENDISAYEEVIDNFVRFGHMYPSDMRTINFQFRIANKYGKYNPLTIIEIPFKFHENEAIYIRTMTSLQFVRVLMRKILHLMKETKRYVPVHDMLHHARSLKAIENKEQITMSISRKIAALNQQLSMYRRLLVFLEELNEDGFYMEYSVAGEYPARFAVPLMLRLLKDGNAKSETVLFYFIEPLHLPAADRVLLG